MLCYIYITVAYYVHAHWSFYNCNQMVIITLLNRYYIQDLTVQLVSECELVLNRSYEYNGYNVTLTID